MSHLTKKQICSLYGVGARTIDTWIVAGCPVAGKRKTGKKGKPANMFNRAAVEKWAAAKGHTLPGATGALLAKAMARPLAAAPAPADPPGQTPPIVNQLKAVRSQYAKLFRQFQETSTANDPAGMASIARALTAKGEELRKLEVTVQEYQKAAGELVSLSMVSRTFSALASGVRERMMALPNELTPILREYLRDPDDVGKIRDELDGAIRHALNSLPDKIPHMETHK